MRRATLLLALLYLAILAALAATPLLSAPPPLRTKTAGGTFDAIRAKGRLAQLLGDQRPHPADSAADDAVRDRLVATLTAMGLEPIVRDQMACNELYKQRGVSCARVRNVIARLGPAGGKAVLLNAHYDSTPFGPGAADDGIGVATLLEVGALLKDRSLRRPVILLFNEGEELGLVGARAFLADPLSHGVDSLVNLEARGVTGPVNMFETSRPNAAAIAAFRAAVRRPVANSLSTDVYRLMPNYTDVNSFAERGWLTLNLAPIGNETRYHSPGDELAALDPATLQHMGDQTLALALRLANGERGARGDRIFADIAGHGLFALPMAAGVGLLALVLLGLGPVATRRGRTAKGIGVTLGSMIGSGAIGWVALTIIGAFRQGMFWRAQPQWTLLATYAGAVLAAGVLIATLGRRADVRQLRAAYWLIMAVLGALIGLAAPRGIVFFVVPPLLALGGMVAARWWKPAEVVGAAAAILFLYLTWGEMLGLLHELLSNGPMWVFAPLASLLVVPVLIEAKPLVARAGLRSTTAIGSALAVAGWVATAAAPAYSAERQQRFAIQHVTDAASGIGRWSVINDDEALPAAYRKAGAWRRGKLPISERERWLADAPAVAGTEAPGVALLSSITNGDERTLTLRLAANGWQRVSLIAPEDSRLREAGAAGFMRPIDQSQAGRYAIDCFGRSCEGLTLMLTFGRAAPVKLIVAGSRAGLPPSAAPLLRARPRFARPQYGRDERIAWTRLRL